MIISHANVSEIHHFEDVCKRGYCARVQPKLPLQHSRNWEINLISAQFIVRATQHASALKYFYSVFMHNAFLCFWLSNRFLNLVKEQLLAAADQYWFMLAKCIFFSLICNSVDMTDTAQSWPECELRANVRVRVARFNLCRVTVSSLFGQGNSLAVWWWVKWIGQIVLILGL